MLKTTIEICENANLRTSAAYIKVNMTKFSKKIKIF